MTMYCIKNYNVNFSIVNKNAVFLSDHLGGFNENYFSPELYEGVEVAKYYNLKQIYTEYVFNDLIKNQYPEIEFLYNQSLVGGNTWEGMVDYNIHPTIHYKNFVCSFNGTAHVSRRLLVSILKKFGYFDPEYCSKNFSYTPDILDGHVLDYTNTQSNIYRKFFISDDSEEFFQKIHSFGHVQYDHKRNIYSLELKLTESFLHIVSETMATSCYPFVTEKFLYSVVTRGLFLAYAPPGWHAHLEKYFGFKRYTKLFDYQFDSVQNPVERLVELMCMISKYSKLSCHDWHDLYHVEQDAIEYNYNHYFSGDYLKYLTAYGQ